MTYFVPIVDGFSLPQSTMKMDTAGQDLTSYLLQLLSEKGHSLISTGRKSLFLAGQISSWGVISFRAS